MDLDGDPECGSVDTAEQCRCAVTTKLDDRWLSRTACALIAHDHFVGWPPYASSFDTFRSQGIGGSGNVAREDSIRVHVARQDYIMFSAR